MPTTSAAVQITMGSEHMTEHLVALDRDELEPVGRGVPRDHVSRTMSTSS